MFFFYDPKTPLNCKMVTLAELRSKIRDWGRFWKLKYFRLYCNLGKEKKTRDFLNYEVFPSFYMMMMSGRLEFNW